MTHDIDLTLDHFPPVANSIGMFLPDSAESLGVTVETFENEIAPVVGYPNGHIGHLTGSLQTYGVANFVRLKSEILRIARPPWSSCWPNIRGRSISPMSASASRFGRAASSRCSFSGSSCGLFKIDAAYK
jgi:hypothetical protein